MDIGFLDKEKLKNIIEANCEIEEDKKICNAFFDDNPENFLIDIQHPVQDKSKEENYIQQHQTRLKWLIEHFTKDVISKAINKNFKGKIVINGDLYSYRLVLFLMNATEFQSICC